MGIEIGGLFGLIVLILDVFALLSVVQSSASTGTKVFWIIVLLVLPIIGFVLWLFLGPKK